EFFKWLFCITPKYTDYEVFLATEKELRQQLFELLLACGLTKYDATILLSVLDDKLITLHQRLEDDLKAIFEFDPAAKSRGEVLVSYPGFFAIAIYRIAHELWIN